MPGDHDVSTREWLRKQFTKMLAARGVEPRSNPEIWREARQQRLATLRAGGGTEGDEVFARWVQEIEDEASDSNGPLTDPLEHFLDTLAQEIERSISRSQSDCAAFRSNIFVGHFPTGSFNAEAVSVEGGYLALINTGLYVMFQQMTEILCNLSPDTSLKSSEYWHTIDDIISVLVSYFRYGNSLNGPTPMSGGVKSLLIYALSRACIKFVIAHEYGHIIRGHLDVNEQLGNTVYLKKCDLSVVRKNWEQELEADDWAYKTTLGVDSFEDIDCSIIDKVLANEADSAADLQAAMSLKCAIAAPFLFLAIDHVMTKIITTASGSTVPMEVLGSVTHPSAQFRMTRLARVVAPMSPPHAGYINYINPLGESADDICERIVAQLQKSL